MKRVMNVIDLLSLKMMVPISHPNSCSDDELLVYIQTINNINLTGRDGRTLLIHAATYNRQKILNYLLDNDADISIQDELGYSALHAAVNSNNELITKILLEHDAPVNALDKYGNSSLGRASHLNIGIIKLLLNYGADPFIKNNYGVSPYDRFSAYPTIIDLFDQNKHKEMIQ